MKRLLLSVPLVTAGLTGCLGDGSDATGLDGASDSGGCNSDTTSGTVRTGQPVWVDARAGGGPAEARIDVAPDADAGIIELTLERDGQEVWSGDLVGVGNNPVHTTVEDLEPGPHRLQARTDTGAGQLELSLAITWVWGTCT